MKCKFTILILTVLCIGTARSQTHQDSLKAIFDSLPTQFYPSNILHNRSPAYTWSMDANYNASPYKYPGNITAPIIKKGWWNTLASDMKESCINPSLIPDGATFRTRDSLARELYDIPIAAMHLDFHQVIPGAVDSGYLWYDTTAHKLSVMPDTVWIQRDSGIYQYYPNTDSLAELAFSEHEVFAGALTNNVVYKRGSSFSISFGLASALFIGNQSPQITGIEMDFDNGEGFKPIAFDIPQNISYSNMGSGEGYEHILRLRLHYGSKVVETRMPLTIVPNTSVVDSVFFADKLSLECEIPMNGFTPDQARISIRYGGSAKKLLKPVILVEGFESSLRDYGDITYQSLSSGYVTTEGGERIFAQAALLKDAFDSLVTLDYDIVYIDNRNPRDHIQANAMNVIKTIQWVNKELERNGSYEKPVVIGASMGGLVARYALSKMEADGCCHNVRLYCTFDSPHNGANIPMGLQAAVKHLRDEFEWIDNMFFDGQKIIPNWDDVLNSPGARQMLVAHYDYSAAIDRHLFMTEFDSLGHPQQCRRIAILNGSEQALANTITDSDKRYFSGALTLPLPILHFPGTTSAVIALNAVGVLMPFPLLHLNTYGESRSNGVVMERNEMGKASQHAAMVLLTHGASFFSQSLAKRISYIPLPFVYAICNAVIITAQNFTNIILPVLHLSNWIVSTSMTDISVPPNYPNYSESPGSTSNTSQSIANSLNGMGLDFVNLYTPFHSFIPAVSALDLDTNDLYLHLQDNRSPLYDKGKIPFDTYWAPGRNPDENDDDRNMQHIEVTKKLYQWMIEQIEMNDQLCHPQTGAYNGSLAGYYNFGRPSDFDKPFLKNLYSVDVLSGGELYINKNGVIGYPGDPYTAPGGSVFSCYTGSACDSAHVSIEDGGLFEIGQANTGNKGFMYFRIGSTLELKNGGTLRITDESRLIIEDGAELIVHPGAIIELEGTDAVLELQGKLTLKENAGFVPTGTGFVRFAQQVASGQAWDNWLHYEGGNYMHFEGTGTGDKRVEVMYNTKFAKELDSVIFKDCQTAFAPGAYLGVHNKIRSTGAHFTAIDSTLAKPEGLNVYGKPEMHFVNSLFSHCLRGLDANLLTYGHPLAVSSCTFRKNTTGLYSTGKNIQVYGCDFYKNSTGVHAQNIDGTSAIRNGNFLDNSATGAAISGQAGSVVRVGDCTFNGPDVGLSVYQTSLRAWCNSLKNHEVGVLADDATVLMGKPQGENNIFTNNRTDIYFFDLNRLKVYNGYNSFSGWYRYLEGSFSPTAANYLYETPQGLYELDVFKNNMPTTGGSTVPVTMNLSGNLVGLKNWAPPQPYTSTCEEPELAASPGVTCCSGISVDDPYIGISIDSAVTVAVGYISDEGEISGPQDEDAMAVIQGVFDHIKSNGYCYANDPECGSNSLASVDALILKEAFEYYLMALSNSYRLELIPLNRAEEDGEIHESLSSVIDEADWRLLHEVPYAEASQELAFFYNISKAHAYRMGEHYEEGLAILDNSSLWQSPEEVAIAGYWSCICEAEKALVLEEIEPAEFADAIELCRQQVSAKKAYILPESPGVDVSAQLAKANEIRASLVPNPSNGRSEIRFAVPSIPGHYYLYSAQGRLLAKGKVPAQSEKVTLDYDLPTGYYSILLRGINGKENVLKWIID